ncbi:hypothetical protein LJY25_04535 [Hymenobacter sp. BT175]|uniref:hypothetical protein n=1 Tax=Hymenobacter translucens TaxID=2886507 RepID=UPI001D0EC0DA|nr:hypothetical protein [Hymenobacter translucens]MCC2545702.1 hypothetical protein [Hymenobacter translucens]
MSRTLLLLALAALPLASAAQSTTSAASEGAMETPWYRPRHLILQTAGGVGMVAGGVGYSFAKDKLETDILVGYVPKRYAGSTLSIATAKFMYTPFALPLGEKLRLHPLTVGPYLSYTHGTINDEERGQYTKDYYWFSSDTRVGFLAGSRLTYLRGTGATGRPRNVSAYYELGSNDLYLLSYYGNRRGLGIGDILTLALGLKADF